MELKISYKVYKLIANNQAFNYKTYDLAPVNEGNNAFNNEEQAIEWIEQRPPQERFTQFTILPIYSME